MKSISEKALIAEPDWFSIAKVKNYKKNNFDFLLKKYVQNKEEVYSKIKSLKKEERNFENTILALENCDNPFQDIFHQIGVYSFTHTKKEYRDLADDFNKALSEKSVDLEYDEGIYQAIVEYREGNYKKKKKEKTDLDKKYGIGSLKLLEDIYKGYKKMGFDLPKNKQKQLKDILKKLSRLSLDFSKNIDEYRDFILCNQAELEGLPENFIKTLGKVGENYKITLDYSNINPFLQYSSNRKKRKEIVDKNNKKGGVKNLKILSEIIKLRNQRVKILGYTNHVDFKTEDRMAKSEKFVRSFLDGLAKKLKLKSDKEILELNKFAIENLEQYKKNKSLEYYDYAYVATKFKEYKYSYDTSKTKEYFELEHVLKKTFQIFGELFNFSLEEVLDKDKRKILVSKEVRLYELLDSQLKKPIAYLVLDLFPREGKYSHAAQAEFSTGIQGLKISTIVCNFSKPNKKVPSFLSLGEVETFFHEFGHALHSLLSKAKYFSQGGTNCDHDFVEVPSQLLENFLYEKENLKKIAIHYQTKEKLEDGILEKIIASRNFLNGYQYLRQILFAEFDLDLHSQKINAKDSAKYYNSLMKKYFGYNLPKDAIFPAGFGHLVGYDAGYYSYLWALVYADDFYSEFEKVKNNKSKIKEMGKRYRKEILEVGGSRKEIESTKKFLQRKPNQKAFLNKLK